MGGRGSSGGGGSLAGAKIDLDYARAKYSESARALNYTNSSQARDRFESWSKELKRAQAAYEKAEKAQKKKRKNRNVPF